MKTIIKCKHCNEAYYELKSFDEGQKMLACPKCDNTEPLQERVKTKEKLFLE